MSELILQEPFVSDCSEFIEAVSRSTHLHHPWVFPPRTKAEFEEYLQRYAQPDQVSYLIKKSGRIVGVINLNNMIRGLFQNAFLGFYVMADYAGQGYMSQALEMVIALAFGEHQLHRLEANIQPENIRSIRLVQRMGFRKEGISPRYLKIDGQWRDHERWALTAEETSSA